MRKEVEWKVRRAAKRRGCGWGVVDGGVISIEAVYLTRKEVKVEEQEIGSQGGRKGRVSLPGRL